MAYWVTSHSYKPGWLIAIISDILSKGVTSSSNDESFSDQAVLLREKIPKLGEGWTDFVLFAYNNNLADSISFAEILFISFIVYRVWTCDDNLRIFEQEIDPYGQSAFLQYYVWIKQ